MKLQPGILKTLLPIVLLSVAVGCTDKMDSLSPSVDLGDEPVMVRATTVRAGVATRAGETEGDQQDHYYGKTEEIKNRWMLFTYPSQPDGKMKSAYCKFDNDGYGYVHIAMDEGSELLRWKEIGTGKEYYGYPSMDAVFLDNLVDYPVQEAIPLPGGKPGIYQQVDNFTKMHTVIPEDGDYKFVSKDEDYYYRNNDRRLQMIAPIWPDRSTLADEVDIICGKIEKPTVGKALHFELEHKMSAISFQFYSEEENLQELLVKNENIDVWLDNFCIWLQKYNRPETVGSTDTIYTAFSRKNGTVYNIDYSYNGPNKIQKGFHLLQDDNGLTNKLESPTQSTFQDESKTYYSTPVWIIPPQFANATTSKENFFKLSIRLGDKIFSGNLPQTVKYWKYDSNNGWQEFTTGTSSDGMKFWKGYHTSFKVKLTSEENESDIQFEQVMVEDFLFIMQQEPELLQSGIYSGLDLETLEQTYNDNSKGDNYKLMRYGRFNNGIWKFTLWTDIYIPKNQDLPKFKNENFEFVSSGNNNYNIYHGEKNDPDKKIVEKSELVDIQTGN